jgi:carotenoid cleavage dioxygenase
MTWAARQPDHRKAPQWTIADIEGSWPTECNGILLRNGPALFQRGSESKRHLFDGDGFAQAWRFNAGSIEHKASWIQTKKFQEEQRAGEFLYPGLADSRIARKTIKNPDDFNTANTNLFPWQGKLLALWEGGSAHELDPTNLDTIGPKIWSPETEAAPFGAHPQVDEQGRLWNIGISGNQLLIYVINSDGRLEKVRLHTVRPCAMAHDFILTKHYLGVWLAPIQINAQALHQNGRLLSAMEWQENEGSHLILIDRDSLEITSTLELESEMIFHFANAWEEDQHLNICYVSNSFEQLHTGFMDALADGTPPTRHLGQKAQASYKRIRLDTGHSESWQGHAGVEFPQIDERERGNPCGRFFSLLSHGASSPQGFNGIVHQDIDSAWSQCWIADNAIELEEHVYTPKQRNDPMAGGWLIGSGYHARRQQSFCSILDAEHLDDGPIAMAYLDGATPICFHGSFSPGN